MFRRVPEHNRYSFVTNPGDDPEFTGFSTTTVITFDVDRREMIDDPNYIMQRLADEVANLESGVYENVEVFIDDVTRFSSNKIRVVIHAKRKEDSNTAVYAKAQMKEALLDRVWSEDASRTEGTSEGRPPPTE